MSEPVRLINDPILRKPCEPVTALDVAFIEGLLSSMNETMLAENGIGLAANQIGHSVRIFILAEDGHFREFINPVIISAENLTPFENEACLSIPGTSGTTQRYSKIKLSWTNKCDQNLEEEFEGMKAFAIQHEMDHLNGVLYVDQFKPMRRSMILSKHKKYLLSQRRG